MKEKIINLFYDNQDKRYTINEISKKTGISYSYVHRQVEELKEKGILIVEKQSNRKYCRPDYSHPEIKTGFIKVSKDIKEKFFKQKKKLSLVTEKLLSELPRKTDFNLFSIILFGSYVKGTNYKESDIDMFFIVSSKEKYDEIIDTACINLSRGFNVTINPIISEPASFLAMLKDRENNVGKEILKNKIIIFGAEKFWELVFEAI